LSSEATLFYAFAAIAVLSSLLVIGQRNPIYSVLLLIASFGALSGLYLLLDAPFAAVIQIIVYAGAIMVLFLFVVMLLNAPREETDEDLDREAHGETHPLLRPGPMRLGAALAVGLIVELVSPRAAASRDSFQAARWARSARLAGPCSPTMPLRSR